MAETNILLLPRWQAALVMTTNADFRESFAFVSGDAVDAAPIDISGIAFRLMARRDRGDPVVALVGSTDDGRLVNHGVTGVLEMRLPAAALAALHPGDYVADILAEAEEIVINLCPDPITIELRQGVTR